MKELVRACRDASLPLIAGVALSLVMANAAPGAYHKIIDTPIIGDHISLHWLVNDVFMAFFFAIAAVEIVHSLRKNGPLNPPKKAVTPLMATVGGVAGPIIVFFILNALIGNADYSSGWGVTTATDIALSWLVAKMIFGYDHPAIKFLLLLAVVDDAIGLVIIAVFYPSPDAPFAPVWLLLIPVAMLIAYGFKRLNVKSFLPYILVCGTISWFGMHTAGLHAALAMVFIIPFMPVKSALHNFERKVAPVVDFGLFFFGFTAAGVEVSNISTLSLIIMLSLIIGKALGIFSMTALAVKLKYPLPEGMNLRDAAIIGIIGGIGLTVALFVCESAFVDPGLIAAAKMGALGSLLAALIALAVARIRKFKGKPVPVLECLENENE
ncbi:MAG: Na+/H+ antiporter NhaA [Firmicutes bacterium]|nr:Na+/H+ antiporter NhaA [Bacillota bacterium]